MAPLGKKRKRARTKRLRKTPAEGERGGKEPFRGAGRPPKGLEPPTAEKIKGHLTALLFDNFSYWSQRKNSIHYEINPEAWRYYKAMSYVSFEAEADIREIQLTPSMGVEGFCFEVLNLLRQAAWGEGENWSQEVNERAVEAVRRVVVENMPDEAVERYKQLATGRGGVKVFLSYSSKDREVVNTFASRLVGSGLSVWYDQHEIHIGDEIHSKISEGINRSQFFCIFLSGNSVHSKWVRDELRQAIERIHLSEGKVFPILLDDCEVPGYLRGISYGDLRGRRDDLVIRATADRVVGAVDEYLRAGEQHAPAR
jgi:hypothetical protein